VAGLTSSLNKLETLWRAVKACAALCATLVCLLVGVDPDTCLREHGHETRHTRSGSRAAIDAGRGARGWERERTSGAAESAGGNPVARGLVAGAAARGAELSPAVNAKTQEAAPVFTRSLLHLLAPSPPSSSHPSGHLRAPDTRFPGQAFSPLRRRRGTVEQTDGTTGSWVRTAAIAPSRASHRSCGVHGAASVAPSEFILKLAGLGQSKVVRARACVCLCPLMEPWHGNLRLAVASAPCSGVL
jgi:hypothetical protein